MSNKLILSVTIPTYNPNADYIIQTIESVLNGGFDSKTMELLVVDNCSDKINVLEICKLYSQVEYVKNDNNLGMTGNWNRCIELAKGKYIHILHDDDYVLNNFYSNLSEILISNNCDVVLTQYYFINKDSLFKAEIPLNEEGFLYRNLDNFCEKQLVQPPSIIVSKEHYLTYGNYKTKFYPAMDWEAYVRLIFNSKNIYLTNQCFAVYRISDLNTSFVIFNKLETNLKLVWVSWKLSFYAKRQLNCFKKAILHQTNWISQKFGDELRPEVRLLFLIIKKITLK